LCLLSPIEGETEKRKEKKQGKNVMGGFVDDLVIFITATSSEAIIIKDCLKKYSSWSGQTVNANKSIIMFCKNTAASNVSAIRNGLPYQITPVNAKHLGLPIPYDKSKASVFSDILDKVNGKIKG
jgi:hypothetical protein